MKDSTKLSVKSNEITDFSQNTYSESLNGNKLTSLDSTTNGHVEDEAELLEIESKVCSYGDTVHYSENPKIFTRSSGSYLFDSKNKPYLDLQMWHSVANLGYANERVNNAVKAQIDKLPQVPSQFLHYEKIKLSQAIAKSIEERFGLKGRVHFNVGGAQAIEDALKLVRRNTGKQHMFAFEGGYHGRTLGASAITSSYRYREPFGEFSDRADFIPYPYTFRCPIGNKDEKACEDYYVDFFERKFQHEYAGVWNPKTNKCEFGALFIEPVQGTGGYIVPPKNYFKRIEKICRKHGILIVVDEIHMGFYRTGKLWSIEHFGIKPDILVFGKALTNGLNPLSGFWAREELVSPEIFGPGSTHSTYSSNSIGTAAGLEVMNIFSEEDYSKIVLEKGNYFINSLKELKSKHPEIGHVDGLGLALRIELCEIDGFTPNRKLADDVFQLGLNGQIKVNGKEVGLILALGGYYKNVLTLAPSLKITYEEIDLAHDILDILITKAKAKK